MHEAYPEDPQQRTDHDHDTLSHDVAADGRNRRELYSALMSGFGDEEQGELERLMSDNEERLRETGDGYAP